MIAIYAKQLETKKVLSAKKMMSKKSYGSAIGFLDLLFNCLIVFVFMFVVAFAQIEPDKKDVVKPKAEYVITLTWERADSSDIDIWIQDPAGNLISFKDKILGLTHLDRDDLGKAGDVYKLPDGRVISYDYNQEIVTIRGFIPGEWIINLHVYNKKNTWDSKAVIRIDKINPSVVTVFNETTILKKHWEEVTVLRFTMKMNGDMVGLNKLPISLIEKTRNMGFREAHEPTPIPPGTR